MAKRDWTSGGSGGERPRPARAGGPHPPSRSAPSRGGPPRSPHPDAFPLARKRRTSAQERALRIVHEDDELLIADKPPGVLTAYLSPQDVPGRDLPSRQSLFDMVKDHIRSGRRRRGQGRVWIIHRLDKEASGLLVFAKTERAFNWLKQEFRAKRVHRLYIAVVEGNIGDGEAPQTMPELAGRPRQLPAGTIQSFILEGGEGESARSLGLGEVARGSIPPGRPTTRQPRARPLRTGRPGPGEPPFTHEAGADGPRLAVTHYRVLAAGKGRSLLQLRLETGRKNQIRVHMEEFGHPIAGDRRYSASTDPISRLCLHATELGFTHPVTGRSVRFSSPAPAAFYGLVGMQPPATSQQTSDERADSDPAPRSKRSPAPETSWDNVAEWYDTMLEEERSDHFEQVILPGTLRLLHRAMVPAGAPQPDGPPARVLDIACGQGALCRRLAELGIEAVGVDASPRLIEAARRRTQKGNVAARYETGDARDLESLREALGASERPFDAALSIMALMNIDPLEPVLRGCASLLKPGGAFVAVILHPAFRAPRQTSWGWDTDEGADKPRTSRRSADPARSRHSRAADPSSEPGGRPSQAARARQYRRIDGYLSPGQIAITMNPGDAAHGAEEVRTWTFHRPLQTYIKSLADAGFVIDALEEWPSLRRSQPGPRAAEENRARREIPLFLALRATRR